MEHRARRAVAETVGEIKEKVLELHETTRAIPDAIQGGADRLEEKIEQVHNTARIITAAVRENMSGIEEKIGQAYETTRAIPEAVEGITSVKEAIPKIEQQLTDINQNIDTVLSHVMALRELADIPRMFVILPKVDR